MVISLQQSHKGAVDLFLALGARDMNKGLASCCVQMHVIRAHHYCHLVWFYNTLEDNFVIKYRWQKCLKESCWLISDKHF